MTTRKNRLEDFFLRIFKVTILLTMSLSLIACLALLIFSVHQHFQTAKPPVPAKSAPVQEMNIEDLKKALLQPEKPKSTGEKKDALPAPTLKYLEQATSLFRCSQDFASKVGAELQEDNTSSAESIENLRRTIERVAALGDRGEVYVKSAVEFTCKALQEPSVVTLRKEGKIKRVFFSILGFHLESWDKIQEAKKEFENRESQRVAAERAAEDYRVNESRRLAQTSIVSAAGAFATFMILALYLLFAKMESNLRDIGEAIQSRDTYAASTDVK
jgi:hypothetical protein